MSFVDLPGPAGRLEALFWKGERPRAAVVVCHPHPLHGGTMHNHVTYRVAEAFRDAGCAALRFNFRGIGRSSGQYDEGRGEVDDAAAALEYLARECPEVPLLAGGFSFGARVALELALREPRVEKALVVGLPLTLYDFDFANRLAKPLAVIHADHDEYGPLTKVEPWVAALPGPARLFKVPDSDHLATGRLKEFAEVARAAVDWLLAR